MNILGISDVTGNHSHSSVAILQDGLLTFALSQERISRVKNDSQFPREAIQKALDFTGLRLEDIDWFACGYPPANYYGSLMARSKMDLIRSIRGLLIRRPNALLRYLVPNIRKGIFDPKNSNGLLDLGVPKEKFMFVDHHLAHVVAGYLSSDFEECLAISYGGFAPHSDGKNVAGAVYRCQGDRIEHLEDIPMFATGCFYSGISVALGFKYMQQEGKTMGLAANGNPKTCYDALARLATRFRDGDWQPYPFWVDYIMSPRKTAFLGTKSGARLRRLLDRYLPQDIASAAQLIWEENLLAFIAYLVKKYPHKKLVLSGGTFLNVRINSAIAMMTEIETIHCHPHVGDGSTTVGAAIEAHRSTTGITPRQKVIDVGLGVEFTEAAVENELRRLSSAIAFTKISEPVARYGARQIAAGKIIGWFQGREEYGQRSLGHRCILADPRKKEMADRITGAIKGRESFIPVSPSCLMEFGSHYFVDFNATPFMNRIYRVQKNQEKNIPGALHADKTARIHSVDKDGYPPFRELIENFNQLSGVPMVLNTSLNRHGDPIAHRPSDAIKVLLDSNLDELVIGPFSVRKITD